MRQQSAHCLRSTCSPGRGSPPWWGIYTEVTQAGRDLLAQAQPTHGAVLTAALAKATELSELAPLVDALAQLALPTKV